MSVAAVARSFAGPRIRASAQIRSFSAASTIGASPDPVDSPWGLSPHVVRLSYRTCPTALWCQAPRVLFPNSFVLVHTKSYLPLPVVSGYARRIDAAYSGGPRYVPAPKRLSGEAGL